MIETRIMMLLGMMICSAHAAHASVQQDDTPPGFTAIFNGENLDGWHGLVSNPIERGKMTDDELAQAREKAMEQIRAHWRAEDGEIVNDGRGPHLCTDRKYRDFEMWIDWKISAGADSGIYLRGSPQVQIWDPVNGIDQAKVGSGGLYNNQKNPSKPPMLADNPAGEWNTFFIRMIGERVTVRCNGKTVVDNVVMENYWDRTRPIFAEEQIELQTHGGEIRFRNIFLREIDPDEARTVWSDGWQPIFNGRDLSGWTGSTSGYFVENGAIVCDPGKGGNLFAEEEFDDFVLRFEFKLPPDGNNGLAIRAPLQGNPAYAGMELQILDNNAEKFATLRAYQYHGSVYGVYAAHRGYLRPVGEWNFEEVTCDGPQITVVLNGTTITDVDLSTIDATVDGNAHPGLHRASGHIGFLGHGDQVEFRNIWIKRLNHDK